MIIVKLTGGLGNQLFQYAAGRSLAYKIGTELKLDISAFHNFKDREYNLYPYNIIENFVLDNDLGLVKDPHNTLHNVLMNVKCKLNGIEPITYKKESHFHFDPEFFSFKDNCYLDGYWQSEKYFQEIAGEIRKEFSLKNVEKIRNGILPEKIVTSNSVSIHIRRGDYVTDQQVHEIHGVCDINYYQRAVREIVKKVEKPFFFIFSDDPVWALDHFAINAPKLVVSTTPPRKNYEDLYLMSLCKHHIIANSSFSWWGAWLSTSAEKIVLAPERWFNDSSINTQDLIPDSWRKI